jgi:erythromycin esterase-like protein
MTQSAMRFSHDVDASQLIRRHAIPFTGATSELDSVISLIGNKSIVLLGEATHGTHEFYKTRIDITRRLIEEHGFNAVAAEADWPDTWRVNQFVKGRGDDVHAKESLSEFQRFPTWLWRNADVLSFVEWLREHNRSVKHYDKMAGFYGLDLYSLYRSADAVIRYLSRTNPEAAKRAMLRYSCLSAFGKDEQAYGYASALGLTEGCEEQVVRELQELQRNQSRYLSMNGRVASDEFFFAKQNARLISTAQKYYREMFRGQLNTWNLRDAHMLETLLTLREHMEDSGQRMKVVVWAHNSHLGDARATEMSERGEFNLGQLIRQKFAHECFSLGFTTDTGTVTAASGWGGPAERKNVRKALPGSFEHLFSTVDLRSFILPMRDRRLVSELRQPRLERAIGVLYLPQTERMSHYFSARLSAQFDAIMHFQETQAVEPLERTARWVAGEDRVCDTVD